MFQMSKIHVLDCTLRDGGYVNDWNFGDANAKEIVSLNASSGVDYVELAFIRLCDYVPNKMQFSEMSQISKIFRPSSVKLAAMVELGYGYPASKFPEHSKETVDLVRLVTWSRTLNECHEYAKVLLDKGYEVAVQATRSDQYNEVEFGKLANLFSDLKLKALYIVDTFGLFTKGKLLTYGKILDENIGEKTCIGYHAHNNMQQAFSNAVAFLENKWNHDVFIDASVMGMGRGAGNLCLELLEPYLNEKFNFKYNESVLYETADRFITPFYKDSPWGYSIPYLLSAKNCVNPTYVPLVLEMGLNNMQISKVFSVMHERGEGIRFNADYCKSIVNELI